MQCRRVTYVWDWEDDMQLLMLLFVGLAAGRTTKGGRKESCISLFRFLHKPSMHMAMAMAR